MRVDLSRYIKPVFDKNGKFLHRTVGDTDEILKDIRTAYNLLHFLGRGPYDFEMTQTGDNTFEMTGGVHEDHWCPEVLKSLEQYEEVFTEKQFEEMTRKMGEDK